MKLVLPSVNSAEYSVEPTLYNMRRGQLVVCTMQYRLQWVGLLVCTMEHRILQWVGLLVCTMQYRILQWVGLLVCTISVQWVSALCSIEYSGRGYQHALQSTVGGATTMHLAVQSTVGGASSGTSLIQNTGVPIRQVSTFQRLDLFLWDSFSNLSVFCIKN